MGARRRVRHSPTDPRSPAFEAVRRIGIECRLVIIASLFARPMRFHELQKVGTGVEAKTLSRVLKYLESEGIVRREVLDGRPVGVEYSLTEKGRELKPVVESLNEWGSRWITSTKTSRIG